MKPGKNAVSTRPCWSLRPLPRSLGPAVLLLCVWLCLWASSVPTMGKVGGRQNIRGVQNDGKLQGLAKFAVQEHNRKQNDGLKFIRLVSADEQVVAGMMYYLDILASSGRQTHLYEAKVWVKSWENFKSLEGFNLKPDTPSIMDGGGNYIASDSRSDRVFKPVSVNDPVVKEASEEAVKGIQQRSNSLVPYELKDILSAETKMIDNITKFELSLKVLRGAKEELFKVEVSYTAAGMWMVGNVNLQHP